MSLLDRVLNTGASAAPETSKSPLISAVFSMLSQGGIEGLVQQFKEKGLGKIIQSWIGTGENLPVSPEQIQSVFSSEQLNGLAQKAGLTPEATSTGLAKILPELINGVTPNGEIPKGDLLSKGMELFKAKIAS